MEEQGLAASYRSRADKLRAIAEFESRVRTHDTLMAIARDYEQLAAALDPVERVRRAAGRPSYP